VEGNPVQIPANLMWLRESEDGAAWLAALPSSIDAVAESWELSIAAPYPDPYASWVAPATRSDGTEVVLKLGFPDRESRYEHAALRQWNGEGAIRLLEQDTARHAMLLERCLPGTPLSDVELDAAMDVMIDLLPRLWTPAAVPFTSLADEAAHWADYLERRWEDGGRPYPRLLLDAAMRVFDELPSSQGEQVLVNQDLHAGNVLRAQREPWLVIDPKPLAGEREFGIAAIVRGRELGHSREQVLHRLDRLCGALDLNWERARAWTLAQTVAWCFDDDGVSAQHIEVARWLHDAA
jgi:streptomycin 6-kinase